MPPPSTSVNWSNIINHTWSWEDGHQSTETTIKRWSSDRDYVLEGIPIVEITHQIWEWGLSPDMKFGAGPGPGTNYLHFLRQETFPDDNSDDPEFPSGTVTTANEHSTNSPVTPTLAMVKIVNLTTDTAEYNGPPAYCAHFGVTNPVTAWEVVTYDDSGSSGGDDGGGYGDDSGGDSCYTEYEAYGADPYGDYGYDEYPDNSAGSDESVVTVGNWYEAQDLIGSDYLVAYDRATTWRSAESKVSLHTGGNDRIAVGPYVTMDVFYPPPVLLEVTVTAYDKLNNRVIPPAEISVRGKQLDEDGTARFVFPAHEVKDVTPLFQSGGFSAQQSDAKHITYDIQSRVANPKVWFRAQAGMVIKGFDPASTNDWSTNAYTSICTNETKSIVEAFVDPPEMASHVKLVVVQTNTTAFLTASPTLLSNGGGGTPITLTAGFVPGTYTVEARTTYNDAKLATLHVKALPRRIVNFGIFAIEDMNSVATTGVTIPAQAALESALNELGEQACLQFQLEPATQRLHHYSYDLNGDGLAQREETGASNIPDADLEDLTRFPGKFRIFMFKNSGHSYPSPYTNYFVRGSTMLETFKACAIYETNCGGFVPRVIVHELGHLVNLSTAGLTDGVGHDIDVATWPTGAESIFRSGLPIPNETGDGLILPDPGRWLRHGDWSKLNDEVPTL